MSRTAVFDAMVFLQAGDLLPITPRAGGGWSELPRPGAGDLHLEPGPGISPHPVGGRRRDADRRGGFVAGQAGEGCNSTSLAWSGLIAASRSRASFKAARSASGTGMAISNPSTRTAPPPRFAAAGPAPDRRGSDAWRWPPRGGSGCDRSTRRMPRPGGAMPRAPARWRRGCAQAFHGPTWPRRAVAARRRPAAASRAVTA